MSETNFQPLNVPLCGTHLIEASAGTGKTWNIAALYTRLVAEEKIPVDKILVVTFTKAATAELKTRLRARLDDALSALQQAAERAEEEGADFDAALAQACGGDAGFLLPLLQRALRAEDDDPERARRRLQWRLKAAVSDFDGAAVYTIHGFCQRVLQDFAFFCQMPFALELDEEGSPHERQTAAQDFWRQRVAHNDLIAPVVYREGLDPQAEGRELAPFLGRPYLAVRPVFAGANGGENAFDALASANEGWTAAWLRSLPLLPAAETAFWQIFPNLNGKSFNEAKFKDRFQILNDLSGSLKTKPADVLKVLRHKPSGKAPLCPFAADYLNEKTNQGKPKPSDGQLADLQVLADLYAAAEALLAAEARALLALRQEMLAYLREAKQARKKSRPERQYDDLLLDVFHALQPAAPHADALARALAANWPVALIDEFQDTDPLQYGVFRRVFADEADSRALFLVGDPKQAVYRFRGADIYAYLDAAAGADARHSLAFNRRSHADLIEGINALFARDNPFVLEEITYPAVSAPREQSRLLPERAPLTVRWLNQDGGENSDELQQRAAAWCADEIAALLNGAAAGREQLADGEGGAFRLPAKGIAVLVRKHQEAEMMQRALARRGVQSVLNSHDSVFAGEEARALAALLNFLLHPTRSEHLVFLLSGSLYRYTAQELADLRQDEAAMEGWRLLAAETAEIWPRFGVYAAVQRFLQAEEAEAGMISRRDWRALTNLHQLLELLSVEEAEGRRQEALLQWLAAAIAEAGGRSGERAQLRLESDGELVKIVTMHAAKGLQYPIVFCPFVWRNSGGGRKQEWYTARQGGQTELVHQSQLTKEDKETAEAETLSEDLRLLYVAFTRAEEQLNLYVGSLKKAQGRNALAYLIEAEDVCKKADAYRAAWQEFAARQNGLLEWREGAPPPGLFRDENRARQTFQAAVYPIRRFHWQSHTSFTALARQHSSETHDHAAEPPDTLVPALDEAEQGFRQPEISGGGSGTLPLPQNLAGFPQGAAAGVCLHEVMEELDFGQSIAQQRETVAEVLRRHGFAAEEWTDSAAAVAEQVRRAPLGGGMTFAAVPPKARRSEMGFLFQTDAFKPAAVAAWLAGQKLPAAMNEAAQRLDFRDVDGFISGFIDELVYTGGGEVYLIDYKSNFLGETLSDYRAAALAEAVAAHHYYLQALIYAVAAVRYLNSRGRQPETVCVRYLFLRGLDGTDNGIWSWDIAVKDLEVWL